jgi:phage gp46-like protein
LVPDGHASLVEVEAEETRRGVLGLLVRVTLVDGSNLNESYSLPVSS